MSRRKTVRLEVATPAEAEALQRAWADPEVRAFILVYGTLVPFSPRARHRILSFVTDFQDEHRPPELQLHLAAEDV